MNLIDLVSFATKKIRSSDFRPKAKKKKRKDKQNNNNKYDSIIDNSDGIGGDECHCDGATDDWRRGGAGVRELRRRRGVVLRRVQPVHVQQQRRGRLHEARVRANSDPTVCDGKCDGFVVPSDDGCGSCTCKDGKAERCSAPSANAPCRDPCAGVTCGAGKKCVADPKQCFTTPCPQWTCVADDGAFKCGCNGATCKSSQGCANNGTCVALPTQNWFADGAPFCVRGGAGRCCGDQFGGSCGASESCINGQCVATSRAEALCAGAGSQCYSCKTPGVKSYFDGCNQCSCQEGSTAAACTKRACDAVLPDPKSCAMQCDGARSQDDGVCGTCLCIGGDAASAATAPSAPSAPPASPSASRRPRRATRAPTSRAAPTRTASTSRSSASPRRARSTAARRSRRAAAPTRRISARAARRARTTSARRCRQ
jgi:hypothetical protein